MYFCYTSHMYRDDAADDDDGDVVDGGCYQDESAKRKNLHDTPASLIEGFHYLPENALPAPCSACWWLMMPSSRRQWVAWRVEANAVSWRDAYWLRSTGKWNSGG